MDTWKHNLLGRDPDAADMVQIHLRRDCYRLCGVCRNSAVDIHSRRCTLMDCHEIIQRLIAESIANYPGTCACPYSTDRLGRKCGNRSAYAKPGGYALICFAGDVMKSMTEAYR